MVLLHLRTGFDLLKYFESEKQHLAIGNYLITAEDISHRITRNLNKYMGTKLLRIALREMIINTIEHENLGISFEEKIQAMIDDNYFEFIAERQQNPKLCNKRVKIEYSIDHEKAIYKIAEEGDGFNHKKYLDNDSNDANKEMLAHGRGVSM